MTYEDNAGVQRRSRRRFGRSGTHSLVSQRWTGDARDRKSEQRSSQKTASTSSEVRVVKAATTRKRGGGVKVDYSASYVF